MEVLSRDVVGVPTENVHVPRDEFGGVWTEAEAASARAHDWYAYGVAGTCRWLACATVRPKQGPWHPAPAPVTQRSGRATPELIEQECLQAELLTMRRPVPEWLAEREGWLDGVCATLNWAWRRTAAAPIQTGYRST